MDRTCASEESGMAFRPVPPSGAVHQAVHELYYDAFPPEDRVGLPLLHRLAANDGVWFWACFDEAGGDSPAAAPCGLVYVISAGASLYVLYLAVDAKQRSRGYGSRILQALRELHPGKDLVLEIEPLEEEAPNYAQRVRRLAFYQRNGFKLAGYDTLEEDMRHTILTTGETFDPDTFTKAVRASIGDALPFTIARSAAEGSR